MGQMLIMLIQDAEAVGISRFPGLGPAAEMQQRRVFHHPGRVTDPGTAQQIAVVVAGVIIPDGIVHFPNLISIHGVENVLIRQEQLLCMFYCIAENIFRYDFLPSAVQIHQQDA